MRYMMMKTINEGQTNKTSQKTPEVKKISSLDGVVCSNPGSHLAPVYKRVYDKDLDRAVVKKVDETDLFEFIQASASQTDLALLERRFIETGEIPQVDPGLKFGVDTSSLPSDIHGVYDMVNDIDANFNKLPQSVKDVFGSSQAYLKSILDGTYQATLISAFNKPADKPAAESEKGE